MVVAQLKRKLKDLRQAEIAIRFGREPLRPTVKLVWNEFFSLKTDTPAAARYTLDDLANMSREELRAVFDDYFAFVYYQYYRERGMALDTAFDPRLLAQIGLPPQASADDIKRRFRELAKKYHPDAGGDSAHFIELMDVYSRLKEIGD